MSTYKKRKVSKYMPADLTRDILLRLPVKSLVRISLGCKNWYHLISSTEFINDHLTVSKSTRDLRLLRHWDDCIPEEGEYFVYPDDRNRANWDQNAERIVPPFSGGDYSYFAGYCNGVSCIRITHRDMKYGFYMNPYFDVVLWNPSIRKYRTIRMRNHHVWYLRGTYERDYSFGFGFDPISRFYKLLNMYFRNGKVCVAECCLANGEWSVSVASHGRPSWNSMRGLPVFMNGKCHWLGYETFPSTTTLVLSFDLHTREFTEFVLPMEVKEDFGDRSSLYVCKAYLSVCNVGDRGSKNCISVWIMKEYGNAVLWMKVFGSPNLTSVCKIVGFRARGEVMYCRKNGQIVSYDPEAKEIHKSGIEVSDRRYCYFDAYKESLVLLDEAGGE